MAQTSPNYRKKGPGRRHGEGKPSAWKPDAHLYGQKLARQAFRAALAVAHAPGYHWKA